MNDMVTFDSVDINKDISNYNRNYNRLDLIDKKFGRLTVIEFVGTQNGKHRESLWKCLCDCGKETITTGNSLTSGNTKSCGCYKKIITQQLFSLPQEQLGLNRVFMDYRKWARKKNKSFELTKEQVRELITSDCYYCGSKPSNEIGLHRGVRFVYQGIDRLDNTEGYIPTNVVPCCIVCNKMKKVKNYNEFVSHVDRIHSLHKTEVEMFSVGAGI